MQEEVVAIEYAVTHSLKHFDTVVNDETQGLIRIALRQGRSLGKNVEPKQRMESMAKFADSLISSREKVSSTWDQVNSAVAKLQKTYGAQAVKSLDSINVAKLKYEDFLGRASGLSDILEGVLQEMDDQKGAQKIIDRLSVIREEEKRVRQASN